MGTFEDLTLFDLEMLRPALFLTLFFEAWSMVGAIFDDLSRRLDRRRRAHVSDLVLLSPLILLLVTLSPKFKFMLCEVNFGPFRCVYSFVVT